MAACRLRFILESERMLKQIKYQHMLYVALIATVLSALYLKVTEISSDESTIEIVSPTTRQAYKVTQEKVIPHQVTNAPDKLETLLLSETNIFPARKKEETPSSVTTVAIAPIRHVLQTPPPTHNPVINIQNTAVNQPPPFRYLGKLLGDDEYQVFLSFQNKNYVLKVGDIIQDMYKVEKIQPPILALNNISSNTLQEINIGE